MNKILSLEALFEFQNKIRDASDFRMEKIKVADQKEWRLNNGALSHHSDGFFHVTGLRLKASNEEFLMLYQPQSALTGLAMMRIGQDVFVLLQARVEPGNTGVVQYGPTIQSTSANYNKMHGGRDTSCLSWFHGYSPFVSPLGHSTQLDIGKRYFLKSKILSFVEVSESIEQPNDPAMVWVQLDILIQAASMDHLLNTDLRSLISVFDWEWYLTGINHHPDEVSLNQLSTVKTSSMGIGQLIPLHDLKRWELCPFGVSDPIHGSLWVDMFHISCNFREKRAWHQPLFCSKGSGLVVLCYKETELGRLYLISLASEPGVPGINILHPSFVIYAENSIDQNNVMNKVPHTIMHKMNQSEEGGRFYENINEYRIIRLDGDFNPTENQFWVDTARFKTLLKTSEKVSIQLRCVSSLIIHDLNPILN